METTWHCQSSLTNTKDCGRPQRQVHRRDLSNFLLSATTTSAKGQTIFEVDNAMEILAENIEKNFNDVPTFLKFMRASMRQAMIRRLAKHSTNKAAWSKAEDFIQDLLQKNTALTLETTQMVIDRAQTYMSREEKLHTSTTLVASTSTDAEIEILKAELASLKAGAVAAAGRGTGRGKQGGSTAKELADYERKQDAGIYTKEKGKPPSPREMAKGGMTASKRADGIATKGKTRGKMC